MQGTGGLIALDQTAFNANGNISANVFYYNRSNVHGSTTSRPFKVVITGPADTEISVDRKTIIVEGGDVYIDQNVSNKLGVIDPALAALLAAGAMTRIKRRK